MTTNPAIADGRHDFDFLFGQWTLRHHRLNRRLVGETEWTDFDSTCVAYPILGGLGNIDENVLDLPAGRYEAVTLRLFDAKANLWRIWWIDARFPGIDTPVAGSFVDGVGTFYGDDVHEGTPVLVRFLWSEITANGARWEQAFSTDGGKTWEINWINRLERVA
jgi:hypothetical protein